MEALAYLYIWDNCWLIGIPYPTHSSNAWLPSLLASSIRAASIFSSNSVSKAMIHPYVIVTWLLLAQFA